MVCAHFKFGKGKGHNFPNCEYYKKITYVTQVMILTAEFPSSILSLLYSLLSTETLVGGGVGCSRL